MQTNRLETFTDGVLAIVITIMVLNFQAPEETDFKSLLPLLPNFFSYILSFVYLGVYWSNHHHLLRITKRIDGIVLWANLHLLFWLSLIPFGASWIGESSFAKDALILYGVILLGCNLSFWILVRLLLRKHSTGDTLVKLTNDTSKSGISIVSLVIGIGLTFYFPVVGAIIYIINAGIWFLPNGEMEEEINAE